MTSKTLFKTLADKDPGILEARLGITLNQVTTVCRQWSIQELALFGSVLREDFGPDSDIDLLITFSPDSPQGLLTLTRIKYQLETLLNKSVDLVVKAAIEEGDNWLRSQEILATAEVIYEA